MSSTEHTNKNSDYVDIYDYVDEDNDINPHDIFNLADGDTGIVGYIVQVTTSIPDNRPHVKIGHSARKINAGIDVSRVYLDNMQADIDPKHNEVADRVISFVESNNADLLHVWNEGAFMFIQDVHNILSTLNKV